MNSIPEIKLKPLEKIKATEYKVNIEKIVDQNLKKYPITTNNSQKKKDDDKAQNR